MLESYKKEKNELLKLYDKVIALKNFFPIEPYNESDKKIDKRDVENKKKELEEEKFFVSFTGQIKAGKSTLINALIFEDEILPSDPTPHTAKITLLKYSKTPKIEAIFYNENEWKELLENKEFKRIISKDVEYSANKGVLKVEYVKQNSLKKEDSVENLKEYVAKEGKYTPFVKEVIVYYPSEILKEVIVVDTPGINDPNKVRDRVTKEWISKSNANLYIIYAGQAFSSEDIDFMNEFLLSIPKNQKITVINKIDTLDNLTSLENYVNQLKRDENLKNKEVLDEDSTIVYVSGLGALIDKMLLKNKKLNENLEFYAGKLEKEGYLEPSNHRLDDVKKAIEEKLIQNKGANLLKSHKKFLESLFEKKLRIKKRELAILEDSFLDLNQSYEEIENEKKIIEDMIRKLEFFVENIRIELKEPIDYINDDFYKYIQKQLYKIRDEFDLEIDSCEKMGCLKNIPYNIKKELQRKTEKISDLVKEKRDEILYITKDKINNLLIELQKLNKNNLVSFDLIREEMFIGIQDLKDNIENVLDKLNTDKVYQNVLKQYKRLFWWDNVDDARRELKEYISDDIIENILKKYVEVFENSITSKVYKQFIKGFEENIRKILQEKLNNLEKVSKDLSNKESLLKEYEGKINNLKKEIENIENLKKEILN